jgi:hypothetical protein
LIFELILIVALAGTVFLLWAVASQVHAPFLPPFFFLHDQGRGKLLVQGTWALEDDKNAWPSQTTTIDCDRAAGQCLEATAVLTGQDGQLFPVAINRLANDRWDDQLVVIRGAGTACVEEIYSIHLRTRNVTGLVSKRADTPVDACGLVSSAPKRMRMIDGYQASLIASGYPSKGTK